MKSIPLAIALVCMTFIALSAPNSLQKGQVIKQFGAYSIAESLSQNGFNPLNTSLPCEPKRLWGEEPPLFHGIGAAFIQAFPKQPFIFPLIIYALLCVTLWLWIQHLTPLATREQKHETLLLSATIPAFTRYSIQFLPDLLATSLLGMGILLWIKNRRTSAVILFLIAVTTKLLVLMPLALLLIVGAIQEASGHLPPKLSTDLSKERSTLQAILKKLPRPLIQTTALIVLLLLPFIGWIALLHHSDIQNPFVFDSVIANRHSGKLTILLSIGYWTRFFTWVIVKGVGLVLIGPAIFWIYIQIKNYRNLILPENRSNLWILTWCLGVVPYWLLVRAGNFVHDYYSLPFLIPLALIGATTLVRLEKKFFYPLALLSVVVGMASVVSLKAIPLDDPKMGRPLFCGIQ